MNLNLKDKAERKTIYLSSLLGIRGWFLIFVVAFGAMVGMTRKPIEVGAPAVFAFKEEERQSVLFALDRLAVNNPSLRTQVKVAIEALYSPESKVWDELTTKRFYEMDSISQQQTLVVWLKKLPVQTVDQNLAKKIATDLRSSQ